jgi:hypothetical protein
MFGNTISSIVFVYMQYVIWLVIVVIMVIGFLYAKEIIAFGLDKLYEIFIENDLLRK